MTYDDVIAAIRQAASTADLSGITDAYLEALGEEPADSASETLEETAERFRDIGNTDAYNVFIAAHRRWETLENEAAEQV